MMKLLKFLFILLLVFMADVATYCEMLTLNDYLNIVVKNNNKLKSLHLNIDAVEGKLNEIETIYSYLLSAGINYHVDKSGRPYNQHVKLNGITNLSYDASVSRQFSTGTQVLFGFNGSGSKYKYAGGLLRDMEDYDVRDIAPFVKLQQSLWKNINGVYTKANIAKAKASAKSALYLLEYKKQNVLFNAKLAYWNLSYAKKVVDFRKMSLDRTEKILSWNNKRYNMDLAEKLDLLQSQAAVKLGELNLRLAYEEENRANRVFNQYLNISDDKVKYDIEKFEDKAKDLKDGGNNKELEKKSRRADVLAALEDVRGAFYDQIFYRKTAGADLVLSGQIALNGLEQSINEALRHIIRANTPSYYVGLRYTLPLDFKLRRAVNRGYEAAKIAAQKSAEDAEVKENDDWLQLLDNWNNAKLRLDLAIEIEKIQQQRHEENKYLLEMGRSTTYLVLQSEQALDDAGLNCLNGVLELIRIYEQVEAFYNYKI
ncbi:MAG: TolC family protein [Endomicrobium sp.]|nr:TolC family protein [Endomicrobium sp.]